MTFQHHESEISLRMGDVAAYLEMEAHEEVVVQGEDGKEKDVKETYERVPPHKWVGRAKGMGFGWHFASLDFKIEEGEGEGERGMLRLKR